MSLAKQMADQFREVHLSGTWIAGTNIKDQLTKVSWQQAVTKIDSLNTLAALAFHINYYIAGLNTVFEGGTLSIKDKYSFDSEPIESQKDWDKLKHKMWSDAERFANHVEQLSGEKLNEGFVDIKYGTYQRNIQAMIEHCYYHLGQIVLIRKIIESRNDKKDLL
jgi:hypothetical protein